MKAVLFDFFGTLVEYQPDRTRLAAPDTHRLAVTYGFGGDHDTFVSVWDTASSKLEHTSRATLREFSMTDAATAFGEMARLDLSGDAAADLGRSYVQEWSRHVHPIPGVAEMIHQLAGALTVAVVSNTHDPDMVTDMLSDMGVSGEVSASVLSVEHGYLKPHPSIYSAALAQVDCDAAHAAFVGDSYEADYLGPRDAGMSAFLIDPAQAHDIPAAARLSSVLDIALRIANR